MCLLLFTKEHPFIKRENLNKDLPYIIAKKEKKKKSKYMKILVTNRTAVNRGVHITKIKLEHGITHQSILLKSTLEPRLLYSFCKIVV